MPNRAIGRPLEFLPDEALEAVMRHFWLHGYERTSMDQLIDCTGLARSSLYNSFGSKRELYVRSFERYQNRLAEKMFLPLENGTAGLSDICAFYVRLGGGLGAQLGVADVRGCLIINSMIEFAGEDQEFTDMANVFSTRLGHALTVALKRAAALREIGRAGMDVKAKLLATLALGINVKARSTSSATEVRGLIDASLEMVNSWRRAKKDRAN